MNVQYTLFRNITDSSFRIRLWLKVPKVINFRFQRLLPLFLPLRILIIIIIHFNFLMLLKKFTLLVLLAEAMRRFQHKMLKRECSTVHNYVRNFVSLRSSARMSIRFRLLRRENRGIFLREEGGRGVI